MTDAPFNLSFRLVGATVTLTSLDRVRLAVSRNDLKATTPILVESGSGEIYSGPAAGFEWIAGFFEGEGATTDQQVSSESNDLPSDQNSGAPPEDPQPQYESDPANGSQAAGQPEMQKLPAITEGGATSHGPLYGSTERKAKSGRLFWIVGLLGAVFLGSRCSGWFGQDLEYYARADQSTLDRIGGIPAGRLARGEPVEVRVHRDHADAVWLKIGAGPNKGRWARREWLDEQVRPTLKGIPVTAYIAGEGVRLREEPRLGSAVVQIVRRGHQVEVLGWTGDGWAEVRDTERGVAYIWGKYVR